MTRRAILHVGGQKTGTTSIQRALLTEREALLGDGLLVPTEGMEPQSGRHRPLLLAMAGDTAIPPRIRDTPDALSATLKAHPDHDVLISCESLEFHFWHPPSPIVAFFASRGYAVELVLYVRPQEERINSSYAQNAKALFGDHDFADILARMTASNLLMYSRWVDVAEAFGARLTVRPYDIAVRRDGAVRDLFAVLGRTPPAHEPRLNETATAATVATGRAILRAMRARGLTLSPRQRARVAAHLLEVAAEVGGEPFHGFDPEALGHVRRHFRGDNLHFARTVWDRDWDDVFPPPRAQHANALSPADPTVAAILATMLPFVDDLIADPSLTAQPWVMDYDEVDIAGIGRFYGVEDVFPPLATNLLRV